MKRDVLFIHGWWGGDWVWSDVVGRFEEADFRPHTLSLPGPGSSQSSFADHLRYALGAARSIGNPILVGHSAGGLLAMKVSETTRPPACIAITPAAPAGVLPRPSGLLLRFLLAALPSILFGRDFFPGDLLRRIALNCLDPARQDDALERMRPVPASQVRLILPSLVRVDRTRMSSPLLVVGAAKDRLTPAKQTRAIARRYGADYREYPDAGHFMTLETPCTVLASDLIAWLDLTTAGEKASSTREG